MAMCNYCLLKSSCTIPLSNNPKEWVINENKAFVCTDFVRKQKVKRKPKSIRIAESIKNAQISKTKKVKLAFKYAMHFSNTLAYFDARRFFKSCGLPAHLGNHVW
jgi:hypothetical protein